MIIKKKSLIVALTSSLVIASVLVFTLVGYIAYVELKGEESRHSYQESLQKLNARIYSRYIEPSDLNARMETTGPLKGKPVIEGTIKNRGSREITDIVIKVNFLDADGAVIYNVIFRPHEPSLGSSVLPQITIPYLSGPSKVVMKPGTGLPFKRILTACPEEIIDELNTGNKRSRRSNRWSGKLTCDILDIVFS